MVQRCPQLALQEYQFEFRSYSRVFQPPLQTGHGYWRDRQGIILKLIDSSGRVGFGEIAPLDWFGSERLDWATQFCDACPSTITAADIFAIPDYLPACQFGFESAWECLTTPEILAAMDLPHCVLLPTGAAALTAPQLMEMAGTSDRTSPPVASPFKWKIGVADLEGEVNMFRQLLQRLPQGANLRLDANGSLSWADTQRWLAVCQGCPQVEFLEQPLAPDLLTSQFDKLLHLADQYSTPIALDESVATLPQLEGAYQQGWRGIFVVKAAIAGSPARLRQFCRQPDVNVVWSSVFETAIAQTFIKTRLIPSVPQSNRAIGFGINHWFTDDFHQLDDESLWQQL
jgi:o-succinylbenzoate synthase